MNETFQQMAADAICFAARQVNNAWQEAASEQMRPCVVFKPALSRDGNMWCALFGENLHEGVAGFGETPAKAMYAFDHAWLTEPAIRALKGGTGGE